MSNWSILLVQVDSYVIASGCEVVVFPSLVFQRHYTVYCPLNAIDLVERRYTKQ